MLNREVDGDKEVKVGKSTRGFATMDRERQRQIASEGGRAAHAQGAAHEFTPEEARVAGQKGGEASRVARLKRTQNQEQIDLLKRGIEEA